MGIEKARIASCDGCDAFKLMRVDILPEGWELCSVSWTYKNRRSRMFDHGGQLLCPACCEKYPKVEG